MRVYFGAGEHPTWRKKLIAWDVKALSINFKHLLPRLPKKGPFLIAERFPDDVHVMAHFDVPDEAPETVDTYLEWVELNTDRLDFAIEPNDAPERLAEIRGRSSCIPLWTASEGHRALQKLTSTYSGIAIPQSAWNSDRPVSGRLNRVAQQGCVLHGLGVSKREILESTSLASISTGSWLSPTKNGETQLWDGSELRRFPASDKSARERYRSNIQRAGFDYAAIVADDRDELTQLALWSWQQYEERLSRQRDLPVDAPLGKLEMSRTFADSASSGDEEAGSDTSGHSLPGHATELRKTRSTVPLPILGFTDTESTDADGKPTRSSVMHMTGESIRMCDNCQLSEVCPSFMGGESCAFSMPVAIRTKDQLFGTLSGLLEMQAHRVFLARFREELEGGIDKSLSDEVDRFFRMSGQYKDIVESPETFRLEVEAKGGAGIISRLFGDHAGQAARALPGGGLDPTETEHLISHVMDTENVRDADEAEVVEPVT